MDRGEQLVHRYLDELTSPAELTELSRLLAESPAAADALAQGARVEAVLEDHLSEQRMIAQARAATRVPSPDAPAGITDRPSPPRPRHNEAIRERPAPRALLPLPSPPRKFGKWVAAASLLVAIGAGLAAVLSVQRPGAPKRRGNDVVSGRVLVGGVEASHVPDEARFEVVGDRTAVLRLTDGSRAELAPRSAAVLGGPGAGAGKVVELLQGFGTFLVPKGAGLLRVETPVGSVRARAAEFTLELQPLVEEEGVKSMSKRGTLVLAVAVLAGQVEVSSSGRDYLLGPGQSRAFGAEGEKTPFRKPTFSGKVVAGTPGKTITLESPPVKEGTEPQRVTFKLTARTRFEYFGVGKDGRKPTVGYLASVWAEEDSADTAALVKLGLKETILTGKVVGVAADGRSLTLEILSPRGGGKTTTLGVRLPPGTKLVYRDVDKGDKPTAGYFAKVWLRPGSKDTAGGVVFSKQPGEEPAEPARSKNKGGKPKKEGGPKTGKEIPPKEAKTKPGTAPNKRSVRAATRRPAPVTAAIDREVDHFLTSARLPASPRCDDAEFLRRVSLDLTGRIPTYRRAVEFLEGKDPDKRAKLIDELLDSPAYGQHLATRWKNRLAPPDLTSTKPQRDTFSPWLAGQFNDNRGWDRIVTDLLTAEGPVADNPPSAFILAQTENFAPQPRLLAAATAQAFLGVQLRCAECHDHPFARWKQTDFWGFAAFFGRVRYTGAGKGSKVPLLTELSGPGEPGKKDNSATAAITVPLSAGKGGGQVVEARFLDGTEPALDGAGPLRPRLAAWVTAPDNPFFANAAANRVWAQLFGRGLVHPADNLDENNPPSSPALLRHLSSELAALGFDLKHLFRCTCNSRAYQRGTRPLPGNEGDATGLSHMNVKALSAEALYDSLAVVTAIDKTDRWMMMRPKGDHFPPPGPGASRQEFARFFRPQGDQGEAGAYSQGIPQLLRLMNAPPLNRGAPLIDKLCNTEASPGDAIVTLYLAALSRRPTAQEVKLMRGYLGRRKDARQGYTGVLWILLNSSEFALNH